MAVSRWSGAAHGRRRPLLRFGIILSAFAFTIDVAFHKGFAFVLDVDGYAGFCGVQVRDGYIPLRAERTDESMRVASAVDSSEAPLARP